MNKNSMVKSATLLIVITMLGKVLGFGREVTIAYLFGASALTDAYLMAVAIPTLLFTAVNKGVSSVFIPVFDRFKSQKRDQALVTKFLLLGLGLVILIFVLPTWAFAPFWVSVFAVGFDGATAELTVLMLRILAFMTLFRFISSVSNAILHVNRNFVIPGLDSFPYNVTIILIALLLYQGMGIYALVWGTLLGVIFQAVLKLPWLFKAKLAGGWWEKCNDGLSEIFLLLPPVILGAFGTQFKAMVDRMFASTLAEGSISYLNYASRLIGLPQALLVVAIITVVYPSMANYGNSGNMDMFRGIYEKAVNTMQFLLMPIIVGFIVLATPIIQFVYQRGSFDSLAVAETVAPLCFFSLGLIGMMLNAFNIKAFYALKDTKTPLLSTGLLIVINIVLNFAFIGSLKHGGLALATSIANWLGGLLLFWLLRRKIGSVSPRPLLKEFVKILLAALIMGLSVYFAYYVTISFLPAGRIIEAGLLLAVISVGAVIYLGVASLFRSQGAVESGRIFQMIKNKFWRTCHQDNSGL